MLTDERAESLAQQLEANPNYRLLRKLVPQSVFANPDGRALSKGVIVDTETTGLSHDTDKIMEIGLVTFEYDPETGQAYRILDSFGALEDPGILITPEVTEITGITNEMVAGKRIDDARVADLISDASIVIAHNAKFDRPFLEQRFQVFEKLPWGCSFAQVDWGAEGFGVRKLDYIAFKFGFFFDAHRAETDCQALLKILQQNLPKSGGKVMKSLLDQLPQKDWTVYALNSGFETKELLKARSYYWDAARKTWHRTVTGTEAITEEVAWLKNSIYNGRSTKLEFEVRDAQLRYSKRPGKSLIKEV